MYRLALRLSAVSRRSIVLFSIGLVWIGYGLAIFTATTAEIEQRTGRVGLPLTQLLAIHMSGWLWVVAGAAGMVVGILRRQLHLQDSWGFNALLLPPMLWSFLSGWSSVVYLITGGAIGNARGWVSSLVWGAMSAWVLITAGWADPDHLGRPENPGRHPDQSEDA